jgi:hypothetical protein
VRQTMDQRAQLMRELHQMQRDHRAQPVSAPTPRGPHPTRVAVG